MRREKLAEIVNRSINQTLSRTILTAGLTFLTVLALYLFGGEVLHGFSFALVIGILIGTYSSIAIAAPILVAYQEWRRSRGKSHPMLVDTGKGKAEQGKGKVASSRRYLRKMVGKSQRIRYSRRRVFLVSTVGSKLQWFAGIIGISWIECVDMAV